MLGIDSISGSRSPPRWYTHMDRVVSTLSETSAHPTVAPGSSLKIEEIPKTKLVNPFELGDRS